MSEYGDVTAELRRAYATSARERDTVPKADWKIAERQAFLERVKDARAERLLEIGAGTGQDSVFFRDQGLEVVATDLTPEMVACCREKGLEAHVRDFLDLRFDDRSFDAVYALNCLLHVPNADLPDALRESARVLRPGGLFFVGVYGGEEREGVVDDDWHDPPRFFSWRTDEQIVAFTTESFELIDFHVVGEGLARFQSLTLHMP